MSNTGANLWTPQTSRRYSSLSQGMVAYYGFNGTTESPFAANDPNYYGYDSVGSADLTVISGPGPDANGAGKFGDHVMLGPSGGGGISSYFSHNSTIFRMTGSSFTISMWIRLPVNQTPASGNCEIIRADSVDYWVIWNFDGSFSFLRYNTAPAFVAANLLGVQPLNTWFNLLVEWDAAQAKAFITKDNGTQNASAVLGGTPNASSSQLKIGSNFVNGDRLQLDEVCFWSRLLTAGEKATLAAGTTNSFHPFYL